VLAAPRGPLSGPGILTEDADPSPKTASSEPPSPMFEVTVHPRAARQLRTIAGDDVGRLYDRAVEDARGALDGATVWHINSTAEGGGVAELLAASLGYLVDDGIAARWLVVEGDAEFFRITKRVHNRLHGVLGDGGALGPAERRHYDEVIRANADGLTSVGPGDVVVVHDPQPLGLVPLLQAKGATVIWTCHVGIDMPNALVRSAWEFLLEDTASADAITFSRQASVWDVLDLEKIRIIPPCIDAFSPKNDRIEPVDRDAILRASGLLASGSSAGRATFHRLDGSSAEIAHRADVQEEAPLPSDVPFVTQVSRWDALKDPIGVLHGFVEEPGLDDAHLVLAGPAPSSVADDPEAAEMFRELHETWRALADADRRRVHLANIPTDDVDENATVVNALQRRADVVVQKSLAEGFGLTVTEAMWKARPVVAGRVGGIQDQITEGTNGLLVDPRDLTAFGNAVEVVLADPSLAASLGAAAEERVRERYLTPHYLGSYLRLFGELR
jgi:trehalose synthase